MQSRVDEMFGAFADFTRVRILHLLQRRESCVEDLVGALGVPQSKVSRHLAHLRDAGLVLDRKDGRRRFYSLAKATSRFHGHLLGCLEVCHREVGVLKQDWARLKKASRP